ncbi:hypothetical protein CLF_112331 [Clonorchis sinensis]|uniref:Uncharacterized protein n=1 Tax=Clonorchis sinensis TaxID=79923 RepID=G7YW78_CLOSI|nr:hypothetical protein CLF_112331 [Clonorchis sinensis]
MVYRFWRFADMRRKPYGQGDSEVYGLKSFHGRMGLGDLAVSKPVVLPLGSMVARPRKDVTAERLLLVVQLTVTAGVFIGKGLKQKYELPIQLVHYMHHNKRISVGNFTALFDSNKAFDNVDIAVTRQNLRQLWITEAQKDQKTHKQNTLVDEKGRVESIRELDEGAELIDIEYARVLNGLRRGVLNELYAKILRRKGELGILVNLLRAHSTELNRCVKELTALSSLTERRYLLTSESRRILKRNVQQLGKLTKINRQIRTTQPQYKVPAPRQLIDVYTENKLLTKALPVAQKRLVISRHCCCIRGCMMQIQKIKERIRSFLPTEDIKSALDTHLNHVDRIPITRQPSYSE